MNVHSINGKDFGGFIRLDTLDVLENVDKLKRKLFAEFNVLNFFKGTEIFLKAWNISDAYHDVNISVRSVSSIYANFRDLWISSR